MKAKTINWNYQDNPYSCWMGTIKGSDIIFVIDLDENGDVFGLRIVVDRTVKFYKPTSMASAKAMARNFLKKRMEKLTKELNDISEIYINVLADNDDVEVDNNQ